jgi:hypothetical protein
VRRNRGETGVPEVHLYATRLELRFGKPHPCITGAPPLSIPSEKDSYNSDRKY